MDKKLGKGWQPLLALMLVLLLVMTACSSTNATEPLSVIGDGDALIDPALPDSEPDTELEPGFTAPLTGIKQENEAAGRPIAVMVNNYGPARPQSGLTHADVMWEVLAEGGITRLVAIFQSDSFSDAIGPIRSIRPYLIELGEMYHGVLAHAGASNDGYAILQRQGKPYLDEISNAGAYFWRESFRKAPHNLYSNLEKLREGAAKKNYDSQAAIPAMKFMSPGEVPAQGADATSIEIKFLLDNYKVSYVFDTEKQVYLRSINDAPHTDMNNDEQLSASNLVVLGSNHRTLDDVGRLAVDLSSGGPAMLFQQGKAIDAEWVRGAADDIIRIVKDGVELPFTPGKTYYHIVPMKPTFADHILYSNPG
ncbi:DUF3048 domain-containing protein [Paenibacillus abyssi]|uniref:Lipoprotein YerB n=1 Tax=Paenibacillus abyssi TaxID=1340531 RepID=A0A917FT57_9BACL|nr:DUF3048 domain-containing protein [Paenibacillus abyssi]GGG02831.1 putative lipoprotein YerB [Paenibacillus abyssi]